MRVRACMWWSLGSALLCWRPPPARPRLFARRSHTTSLIDTPLTNSLTLSLSCSVARSIARPKQCLAAARCCLTATAPATAAPGAAPRPGASAPGSAAAPRGRDPPLPATPTAAGLALAPGDVSCRTHARNGATHVRVMSCDAT